MNQKLNYIDLFAGCGGLPLGFESVGFNLIFAVEKSPMAAETFYHNFINNISNPKEWDSYLNKSDEDNHVLYSLFLPSIFSFQNQDLI